MPRVRYFHLVDDRLERLAQQRVFDAWAARKPWDDTRGDHEVRLVEAVFDDADRLARVDFIRIAVRDGWITPETRSRAARAKMSDQDGPEAAYHLEGWPMTIRSQLAVALDSILMGVRQGAGGLLAMSEQLGVPVRDLLRRYAGTLNNLRNEPLTGIGWADR
jgi:hypothetical protein